MIFPPFAFAKAPARTPLNARREPRADLDVARVVPILVDEPERRIPRINVRIP
jgi:hypothetical protein